MRGDLDEAEHRAALCRDSIAKSNRGRLELEAQDIERQLAESETGLKAATEAQAKAAAKQKEVEKLMKEGKDLAERQKKQAEKQLKQLTEQLEKHKQASENKMQVKIMFTFRIFNKWYQI